MELWQDTQLFFNKMIFHFDVEEDLPALLAFITSFLVSILTLYGITKALGFGLFSSSSNKLIAATKVIPGVRESDDVFSVQIVVGNRSVRAVVPGEKDALWEVDFLKITNWGHSPRVFRLIYFDENEKKQTVNFMTNLGKEISDTLNEKVARLEEVLKKAKEKREAEKKKNEKKSGAQGGGKGKQAPKKNQNQLQKRTTANKKNNKRKN